MFSLLFTVIIGFVVGAIAKAIRPGRENFGFWATAFVGIGGSVLGTFLGRTLGVLRYGQSGGFVFSIVGAVLVLVIYSHLTKK